MVNVTLNWTGQAGTNFYLVQFKKDGDTAWSTPPAGNPTTLLTYVINNLLPDTVYTFRISSYCDNTIRNSVTIQKKSPPASTPEWIINTFTCEQETVFDLDSQITGLSSPAKLMYDSTTGRVYGTDMDNVNGCFFWYLPTATTPGGFTYIQPILSGSVPPAQRFYYASEVDPLYRRLYTVGKDTDGLQIYDIASNTVSVIPYGYNVNVPPNPVSGNGFNRYLIKLLEDEIICNDTYSATLTRINRTSLTLTASTPLSSIADSEKCLIGSPAIHRVGNEYWVLQSQANLTIAPDQEPHVFKYNLTFSNTPTIIDLSSVSNVWTGGGNSYWRASYQVGNFIYVLDIGSNNLIKIDTTTDAVTVVKNFDNRSDKTNTIVSFIRDPITNELFLSGSYLNDPADLSPVQFSYKWDEATDTPIYIYPTVQFSNLTQIGTTNELHGATPNAVAWVGGPWNTDGIINKFLR